MHDHDVLSAPLSADPHLQRPLAADATPAPTTAPPPRSIPAAACLDLLVTHRAAVFRSDHGTYVSFTATAPGATIVQCRYFLAGDRNASSPSIEQRVTVGARIRATGTIRPDGPGRPIFHVAEIENDIARSRAVA